ncbi:MAG: MFS transporter [Rhizobiaceae bacterium]
MRGITLPLALGQTIIWAASFYLLPALLPALEAGTDWSKAHITGALTVALLVSATAAPFVGRGIDLGFGRTIMVTSMACTGLLLLVFSFADNLWLLYGCWFGIGLCMAGMLYEPCFAIVTRHYGADARRVITHITLVAGFAGTLSFPINNYLSAEFSWQIAVRFFAFAALLLALPLSWVSLGKLYKALPIAPPKLTPPTFKTTRNRALFWSLALAFTLGGLNHGMVIAHLLPMLAERGMSQNLAVIAAMLIGPMQVLGRFIFMLFGNKTSSKTTALICLGGMALAAALLWAANASAPLIFLATAIQGGTWGLVSITKPTIIREMLGQVNFGVISGQLASVFTFGIALAPFFGTFLWGIGGYDLMLVFGFSFAVTGIVLLYVAFNVKTAAASN